MGTMLRVLRDFVVGLVAVVGLIVFVVWLCATFLMQDEATPPKAVADDGSLDALLQCQSAIKAAAKNPSTAEIPYASDLGSNGNHVFNWERGQGLRLQNALGAHNDAGAACIVKGGKVVALIIDGVKVIYDVEAAKAAKR